MTDLSSAGYPVALRVPIGTRVLTAGLGLLLLVGGVIIAMSPLFVGGPPAAFSIS